MNNRGSASLEACIVMPVAMVFIALFLVVNFKFYGIVDSVTDTVSEPRADYAEVSRCVRVIFETGGDIYDLFFG